MGALLFFRKAISDLLILLRTKQTIEMNSGLVVIYAMNCGESGLADVKTSGVVPLGQRGAPANFSGMCYFLQFKKFKIKKIKNPVDAIFSFLCFKLSPYPPFSLLLVLFFCFLIFASIIHFD